MGTRALKEPKKGGERKIIPSLQPSSSPCLLLLIPHHVSQADSPCNSQKQSCLPSSYREDWQKDMDIHSLLPPAVLPE